MFSLSELYQVAGISKQGITKYNKKQSIFNSKLEELAIEVDILRSQHPGCGVEKMYNTLNPDFIGRDRFINIFMELGYRIKKKKNYRRTTIPAHYKYPNLIEGSLVTGINQVWQSDITYIYVVDKYFYLVFILDIYSRRIIGYQASDSLRVEANINALKQAFKVRKSESLDNLIHHSDRGSQYISGKYLDLLSERNIEKSMGLVATDNAFAERINGTIKNEYLLLWGVTSFQDLNRKLKRAVYNYNNKRIHNHLPNKATPIEFEENLLNLEYQKRPTVIIYTDGYDKIQEASSLLDLQPEKNLAVHICPIVYERDLLTKNGQP